MPDNVKKPIAATLFAVLLLATGCSDGSTEVSSGNPTSASPETTSSPPATMLETTADTGTLEGNLGEEPEVVLRVEGDSGVRFSGLCDVGGEESVLGGDGLVPDTYSFDPGGQRLSCEIQKRDPRDGDLKVTLLAGDSTHSVQQINTPDGVINVSYDGG